MLGLRKLFRRIKNTTPPPVAGEVWEFVGRVNTEDPFGPRRLSSVGIKILDVSSGWVRYAIGSGPFGDERMKIKWFVEAYRKKQPPK